MSLSKDPERDSNTLLLIFSQDFVRSKLPRICMNDSLRGLYYSSLLSKKVMFPPHSIMKIENHFRRFRKNFHLSISEDFPSAGPINNSKTI